MRRRLSGVVVRAAVSLSVVLSFAPRIARGQTPPPAPTGAPPAEAKALVEAPKEPGSEPDLAAPVDGTTAGVSAGGQLATGNSRLLAGTVNGTFESRYHDNGIGASILGNYGQGAPPGQPIVETSENVQGRLRYDRYVVERASVFLIYTGRHDRFQGLDYRMNVDPGFKYMLRKAQASSLWIEAGYDFQYDVRRGDALAVVDDSGKPVLDASGNQRMLDKTATDHSTRAFVGLRHAFNKEVTLSMGLEYLQSVVDSTRYRVNFDGLFAAKVGGGLALGLGYSARYDHAPLPGKDNLDTTTTVSLIFSYSDIPQPKPPEPAPEPEPAPAPSQTTL